MSPQTITIAATFGADELCQKCHHLVDTVLMGDSCHFNYIRPEYTMNYMKMIPLEMDRVRLSAKVQKLFVTKYLRESMSAAIDFGERFLEQMTPNICFLMSSYSQIHAKRGAHWKSETVRKNKLNVSLRIVVNSARSQLETSLLKEAPTNYSTLSPLTGTVLKFSITSFPNLALLLLKQCAFH